MVDYLAELKNSANLMRSSMDTAPTYAEAKIPPFAHPNEQLTHVIIKLLEHSKLAFSLNIYTSVNANSQSDHLSAPVRDYLSAVLNCWRLAVLRSSVDQFPHPAHCPSNPLSEARKLTALDVSQIGGYC